MFDSKFASGEFAFDDEPANLYEVLNIKPEASPAEIRESYLRIKNTYAKDSVALYTLIGPGEREDILKKIEQAYAILSNPVARREYDHSFSSSMSSPWLEATPTGGQVGDAPRMAPNVVSIDRVPPMESVENAEQALVAPVTDFGFQIPLTSPSNAAPSAATVAPNSTTLIEEPLINASPEPVVCDIDSEIQAENEWSGPFIRKVREARGISIEEIIQSTRITRAYVLAIEEENFGKLPAPVYVRGFVNQISRILRVANKDVASAYMRRCQRLNPEKFR